VSKLALVEDKNKQWARDRPLVPGGRMDSGRRGVFVPDSGFTSSPTKW